MTVHVRFLVEAYPCFICGDDYCDRHSPEERKAAEVSFAWECYDEAWDSKSWLTSSEDAWRDVANERREQEADARQCLENLEKLVAREESYWWRGMARGPRRRTRGPR